MLKSTYVASALAELVASALAETVLFDIIRPSTAEAVETGSAKAEATCVRSDESELEDRVGKRSFKLKDCEAAHSSNAF